MALISSKLAARRMLAIAVPVGVIGVCLPGSFYLIRQGWGQPLHLAGVLSPLLSATFTWLLMAPQRHLHPIVVPLSLWCLTATGADALPFSSAGHEMALVTAALAYIAYKHERRGLARALTLALGVALACIRAQALMHPHDDTARFVERVHSPMGLHDFFERMDHRRGKANSG